MAKDNTALRLFTAHELTVIVICILDLSKTVMGTSFVATLCSTFGIFPIISEKLCKLYTYLPQNRHQNIIWKGSLHIQQVTCK